MSRQDHWKVLIDQFPRQFVNTDGLRLGYREAGHGQSLVMLHGIGSASSSFVLQLDSLRDTLHRVAWDMPGYCDSDHVGEATLDEYSDRVALLIEHLKLDQPVVLGHSLGALIATRFAVRYPDNLCALILADPALGHGSKDEQAREAMRNKRLDTFKQLGARDNARARAPALLSSRATPEQVALVEYNMAALNWQGYANACMILSQGRLLDDATQLVNPTMVLYGLDDTITPPESALAAASAARAGHRCYGIPGGHACYIESPESFNAHVTSFIEDVQ